MDTKQNVSVQASVSSASCRQINQNT